ncbi:DNA cytosine methyltransferase [Bacillus toyonensis]|uniref:DNA cytosine methyltransferase n=1 Tax=Bacillus toyonensis TaxID=155322 RepID=UPI0009B1E60B|nr:DNA cytosine methyltransferase [Bacillus toyonensis]OQD36000.1 Modification methylase BspRI [Bacillus toyonensis]
MKKKYVVLDLFSGAGGMSEGFLQAGFHIPCATDYSKEVAETYINRHQQLGYDVNYYSGDIRELTKNRKKFKGFIGENKIDVIVGGPPCQGFSLSGKRLEDDIRNTLFIEYLRMVKLVKPKYFVMENVEGLLSYKFRKIKGLGKEVYEEIYPQEVIEKEALRLGYHVKWKVLNAKDFGVPQNRPRVIFLGHRIKKCRNEKYKNLVTPPRFPTALKTMVTIEDAISDLNFIQNGEVKTKYDKRFGNKSDYQKCLKEGLTPSISGKPIKAEILYNHQASKHNEKTLERFKLLKSGESINALLQRLPEELKANFATKKFRCTKLDKNNVSPTVLTLPDDIIHYDMNSPRILTVRELARLQSFDDSFEFRGKRTTGGNRRKFETPQYTQVGNAVPPLFARAIAKEIYTALSSSVKNEGE